MRLKFVEKMVNCYIYVLKRKDKRVLDIIMDLLRNDEVLVKLVFVSIDIFVVELRELFLCF